MKQINFKKVTIGVISLVTLTMGLFFFIEHKKRIFNDKNTIKDIHSIIFFKDVLTPFFQEKRAENNKLPVEEQKPILDISIKAFLLNHPLTEKFHYSTTTLAFQNFHTGKLYVNYDYYKKHEDFDNFFIILTQVPKDNCYKLTTEMIKLADKVEVNNKFFSRYEMKNTTKVDFSNLDPEITHSIKEACSSKENTIQLTFKY